MNGSTLKIWVFIEALQLFFRSWRHFWNGSFGILRSCPSEFVFIGLCWILEINEVDKEALCAMCHVSLKFSQL